MTIGKRASANAVIKAIMSKANGIGESKSSEKLKSDVVGQSGHKVSTKAHSIKSIQNLRTVTTQYIDYLKGNHGNKVVQHINGDTAREFLSSKNISGGSLNTYISTMAKMSDNLQKIGIDSLSRKEVQDIRTQFKAEGINLQKDHIDRSYTHTDQIIKNVELSSSFGLSARLGVEAGLRLDDAINSEKWRLNEDNSLHISGSKNGLDYTTVMLDPKLVQQVQEAINSHYKIDKNDYRSILKEAVEKTGQNYNGTHGLRYSFAQDRIIELKEFGYTHSESLSQISLEMGHSREEITLHYL